MLRPCEICRQFFEVPENAVFDFESYCDILRIDGRAHIFLTGRAAEILTQSIIAEHERSEGKRRHKPLGGFNAGELDALLAPAPETGEATLDSLFAEVQRANG